MSSFKEQAIEHSQNRTKRLQSNLENIKLPPHTAKILALFDPEISDNERLWWRVSPSGEIRFMILCNDFFDYATADAEVIEEDDIALLEQSLEDLRSQGGFNEVYLAELFICRKRNRKPLKKRMELEGIQDNELFTSIGN